MATYYIDPTVSAGGAGTPGDPFSSYSEVPTPTSNDTVLFKRGTTHTAASVISLDTNQVMGAYYNSDGSDDPSQAKPILTSTLATILQVFGDDKTGCRLYNLDVRGSATGSTDCIRISVYLETNSHNGLDFEAVNCDFSLGTRNCVRIFGSNCRFYNCNIFDKRAPGELFYASGNNIKVINSNFWGVYAGSRCLTASDATGVANVEGWLLEGSTFESIVDDAGCVSFDTDPDVTPAVNDVIGCTFKYGQYPFHSTEGLRTFANNLVITGEQVIAAAANAIYFERSLKQGSVVRNNVIVDTNNTTPALAEASVYFADCDDVKIFNNTIIGSKNINSVNYPGVATSHSLNTNVEFRNNIVVGFYDNIKYNPATTTASNNCSYDSIHYNVISNTGTEITDETDSISTNPLLNTDYSLMAASPCIGTGYSPIVETDIDGKYRTSSNNDMGAKWFDAVEDSTVELVLASGGIL